MNKKKILTLLVTTSLLAVVGVGSTLAYFTDKTETLTNVVTMGNVNGVLVENGAVRDKGVWNFTNDIIKSSDKTSFEYKYVMPGDIVTKNPTVCLTPKSANAWVRLQLDIEGDDWLNKEVKENQKDNKDKKPGKDKLTYKDLILNEIEKEINWENWTKGNEIGKEKRKDKDKTKVYYYYNYKLVAPETSELEGNYIQNLKYTGKLATLFERFEFPSFIDNIAADKTFKIKVKAELIQGDHITFIRDNKSGHEIGWYAAGSNDEVGELITSDMIESYPVNQSGGPGGPGGPFFPWN